MSTDDNERLTDLEMRLMHQEDAIDSLTESLVRQQRVMDQLYEHIEELRKRLHGLEEQHSDGADSEAAEPPPPHY